MKRQIKWASQHLEIDTLTGKLREHEDLSTATYNDSDEYEEDDIQNVMSTPFGLWKVDDSMHPYKQFKLWMGHTNFTITKTIGDMIKCIPGVEILSVLTRYRFMIGIGEMFDIRDVRVAIEKQLKCDKSDISLIEDSKLKAKVEELRKSIAVHDKWAIYVFPNGSIDFATNERGNRQFTDKLLVYKNAVDHSAGILIENTDE